VFKHFAADTKEVLTNVAHEGKNIMSKIESETRKYLFGESKIDQTGN